MVNNPPHSKPESISALLEQRIGARKLPPAALKVVTYIERNPGLAITCSAAELARGTALSDATVIRAVQALGFSGMADLRRVLADAMQGASPAARMRRTLSDAGEDAARAVSHVIDTHQDALTELKSPVARDKIAAAIGVLGGGERIVVFGIGPSGMLARYAAMMLTRAGRPAKVLDATGLGLADQLLDLRAGDVVLLLAYGPAYREVTATIAEAHRKRLPIVLITDSLEPRLARMADVIVPARRGRAERVALHGATIVALEALVLGLAAADRPRALETLDQLDTLREAVAGKLPQR